MKTVRTPLRIRRADPAERGVALNELAVALPLLVLLVLGMVDFGALLLSYIQLEQAAREGVRTAGKLSDLAIGDPTLASINEGETFTHTSACNTLPKPSYCEHVLVHARVRNVMRNQNTWNVEIPEVDVITEIQPPPPGAPSGKQDTVMVRLGAPYDGFLFSYTLNITMRGPWLF